MPTNVGKVLAIRTLLLVTVRDLLCAGGTTSNGVFIKMMTLGSL